jgi:hypothetical protein
MNRKIAVLDEDKFEDFTNSLYDRFSATVKSNVRYSSFRVERYEDLKEYYLNTANAVYKFLKEYGDCYTLINLSRIYDKFCDKVDNFDIAAVYASEREKVNVRARLTK